MVEKQPGMAYALAAVALGVGEQHALLWPCLLAALRTECCYNVPHHPNPHPNPNPDPNPNANSNPNPNLHKRSPIRPGRATPSTV